MYSIRSLPECRVALLAKDSVNPTYKNRPEIEFSPMTPDPRANSTYSDLNFFVLLRGYLTYYESFEKY